MGQDSSGQASLMNYCGHSNVLDSLLCLLKDLMAWVLVVLVNYPWRGFSEDLMCCLLGLEVFLCACENLSLVGGLASEVRSCAFSFKIIGRRF